MMLCAWLLSSHRWRVPWRVIAGGLLLQFGVAALLLHAPGAAGKDGFLSGFNNAFNGLLGHVDAGARFVFGPLPQQIPFAFRVLPTIIFFSALMALLYHLGILPRIVQALGGVMRVTLGTSGAESLSTAANIFAGRPKLRS